LPSKWKPPPDGEPPPLAGNGPRRASKPVDFGALARFRYALRKFLAFSEAEAAAAGISPQQYQALVIVKGCAPDGVLSIGELADWLCVRPHTALGLAHRMVSLGLIRRSEDPDDRRRVLISLTEAGEIRLRDLAGLHVRELDRIGPALMQALHRL
jgi:DNA-binding MarR family transcriptional regulator